ncbi:MAG: CorA family divalent cation transporter [Candidatus Contendobacter sp.]|nr:CorA family divalent cation transporter [Candidatus Contendobacter sp.]MDS4059908.1 CorA family divalent cation transporter [Candidatus Contendobacter sp.]
MSDVHQNHASPLVRHFRQILLWPLQVMHARVREPRISKYWELLEAMGEQCPWREVADEFGDPDDFQERHYKEFITFLPYVQRFLYGEGMGREGPAGYGKSPIRVYRRRDVARMRVALDEQSPPVVFEVAHIDLYFFYDIDIIILAVEFFARDLPLPLAQDVLFKLGRAYPAFWEANGQGGQCPRRVEWLAATGETLAVSDYENRRKYLKFVCQHRSPNVAAHWDYLLQPLALYHSDREGVVRYRQIEYHRMPLLAYLSFDDPRVLTRGDFARLALVTRPGPSNTLPYSERELAHFERKYCYDKFWSPTDPMLGSRYLCCGHAFVMVGQAHDRFFTDAETGLLGQFRHQYFLVNLIAHFHKATLMLFSEWLVTAISQLDIRDVDSVKTFKRDIRRIFETFLRFTHRYWFHEVSNQAQAKDLFRMLTGHLDTDRIYRDVSEAVKEMEHYLDSDGLRRQANTVVRLTVVTTLGLIATVLTGFLGMNIFDHANEPAWVKLSIVVGVLIPAILLVFYGVAKSKVLSDFLEALADERLTWRDKLGVLFKVRGKRP